MPMHMSRKHKKEILFCVAAVIAAAAAVLGVAYSVPWVALIPFVAIGLACLWLINRLQ